MTTTGPNTDGERGQRASFDRKTGEAHGSGSGAGGNGNPDEDYDNDSIAGGGADPIGGPRPEEDAARKPQDKHQGHYG